MLTWWQALVLGIVQGITEFVPISSSGHLVLVPYLLAWPKPSLAFDVALHMGTAAAVIAYFRAELWAMVTGLVLGGRGPDQRLHRRLALLVVAGTIPVAVVGIPLRATVEEAFASPLATSGLLLVTAVLLVAGERWRDARVSRSDAARAPGGEPASTGAAEPVWTGDWTGRGVTPPAPDEGELPSGQDPDDPAGRTLHGVTVGRALTIGMAQILALFPGVSRSGSTIVAGMVSGLSREAATRFSFLLALPALFGAGLVTLPDLPRDPATYSWVNVAAGTAASFVAGYLAIGWLVRLVARERLTGFARYCLLVAVIGFVGYLTIGPPSSL